MAMALLAGWSVIIWARHELLWMQIAALVALNGCVAAGGVSRGRLGSLSVALAWVCSASLVVNSLDALVEAALSPDERGIELALTPEVIALAAWLAPLGVEGSDARARWRRLALFWLLAGEVVWVCVGNFQNLNWLFFGAWTAILLTIIESKRRFHYGVAATLAANTAIVTLVGIPLVDLARGLASPETRRGIKPRAEQRPASITAENAHFFYSYEDAGGDPEAFASWRRLFDAKFFAAGATGYLKPMPHHLPPFCLRPGGRGVFLDCLISINSRGFRGREIEVPKPNVYRIVCLGESTTFGMTFRKDDKPWPEVLEKMINDRLKPGRPVEVINAGIPAWSLEQNVERLVPEILPLQPDMIISYHGYNGLAMIDDTLPPVFGPPLPMYPDRPLRLASDIEYRFKVASFIAKNRTNDARQSGPPLPPLKTRYAACYRRLIEFAQTNHIRLALGNFSMAFDEHSSHELLNFYDAFGSGVLYVRANAIHSGIVRQLAEQNPGVIFIDTHPGLHCVHSKFTDGVHLTQEGRQQMAENMFAGIRAQLERDLGRAGNGSGPAPPPATFNP